MSNYVNVSVAVEASLRVAPAPDDVEDQQRAAWDELKAELRRLCDDPRFEAIFPEVQYGDES